MTVGQISTGADGQPQLPRVISGPGFFALSFGTIVGSAWVLMLGVWLKSAGPGGAMIGFAAGTVFMLLVSAYYGELACRMPLVGGEATYAEQVLGRKAGMLIGWFLLLFTISFCGFEGLALAWLLETLFPSIKGGELYRIGESSVSTSSAGIGLAGAVVIGWLNTRRVSFTVLVQKIVTFTFIGASILLMIAGFLLGDGANAEPFLAAGSADQSWVLGSAWIFATSATFLTGFQAALHVIEERAHGLSARDVVVRMMAGVAVAGAFYTTLVLSASRAAPWRETITKDLPAAEAFGALPGAGHLRTIVLVVAVISLFKAWNALTLMASRLIYARARDGMLPAFLARLTPGRDVPGAAVAAVTVIASCGILVGRSSIVPILNTASVSIAVIYVVIMAIVIKLRRAGEGESSAFRVPGGWPMILLCLAGLTLMAAIALFEPYVQKGGLPAEWILLLVWLGLGLFFVNRGAAAQARGTALRADA